MYLYLLSQDVNNDYGTFDSCVVVSSNADYAWQIHPAYCIRGWDSSNYYEFISENDPFNDEWSGWCQPGQVKVTYLGEFKGNQEDHEHFPIICASFNDG